MTTRVVITLPIAPGAKTCEGCPHCFEAFDACQLFRSNGKLYTRLERDGSGRLQGYKRLPECLAAERVLASEHWDVRVGFWRQRFTWEPSGRDAEFDATQRERAREASHKYARENCGKVKHVTRWTKP